MVAGGRQPGNRSRQQPDTLWNYWLGGRDNYAVDREAGDRVAAMLPSIVAQARADRAFLGRAIRHLAGAEGIRQFLDVGTGLPTAKPGSYVAINHSTSAVHGEDMEEAVRHWNKVGTPSMTLRTPEQIAHFFDGLELLPPGVVSCSRWRPDPSDGPGEPEEVDEFCGVARNR